LHLIFDVVLLGVLVYLDRMHSAERAKLYDRIQAGTIRDYQAFKSVEPERKKVVNVEIPTIVQPEEPPAPPMMPIGEVHAAGGRLMGG
jgi:hypothetical protein